MLNQKIIRKKLILKSRTLLYIWNLNIKSKFNSFVSLYKKNIYFSYLLFMLKVFDSNAHSIEEKTELDFVEWTIGYTFKNDKNEYKLLY